MQTAGWPLVPGDQHRLPMPMLTRGDRPAATDSQDRTVTALSRLEVRSLAREEFLAAVTGNPESVERAEEVISTRLQAG